MKKYEFTGETKTFLGRELRRIKALASFSDVAAGEIGGWIENESNLSQTGDARVYGDAWVYGDARVFGDARVCGDAQVFWVSKIGSRLGTTTFFKSKLGVEVSCGCFSGTLEQFEAKVNETHGNDKYGEEYRLAIELAKLRLIGGGNE